MSALSIAIVESAPRLVACLPGQATVRTIAAVSAASPVWTTVFERRLTTSGWLIVLFPDAGTDDIIDGPGGRVLFGHEVVEPFESDATLLCERTPAGRAAMARWIGPYEKIVPVHAAIRDWCATNGHALAGPVWEVCRWSEDPARQVSEVHYLLN